VARQYADPCGIARALDRIGERWALLVVRELMLGPKRFTDLKRGLPTASPNVLSQRLDELEEEGIVARKQLPSPYGGYAYDLTERGRELEPVLIALARWGSRAQPVPAGDLSDDALLFALRTTFTGAPVKLDIELVLSLVPYHVVVDGELSITRGTSPNADARIETDGATLRQLVFRKAPLAAARKRGAAKVSGDLRAAARFVKLFSPPRSA
jgi:DNA-binding HxlR family transcriptional regulator